MAIRTVNAYGADHRSLPQRQYGEFEHAVLRIGVIFSGLTAIEQLGSALLPVSWLFLLAGLAYVLLRADGVAAGLDGAELSSAAEIGDGVLKMMARRRLARPA